MEKLERLRKEIEKMKGHHEEQLNRYRGGDIALKELVDRREAKIEELNYVLGLIELVKGWGGIYE